MHRSIKNKVPCWIPSTRLLGRNNMSFFHVVSSNVQLTADILVYGMGDGRFRRQLTDVMSHIVFYLMEPFGARAK